MLSLIERLKIRLAVSLGWRLKGKMGEAVRGFQATEADGIWHLHRGIPRLVEARHRAVMFAHSLEEESHAEEFARVYNHYSDRAMTPAPYERRDLYGPEDPMWKVFAYVHVGEEDATDRFRYLRDALEAGALKEALGKIVSDEEGHVDLTNRMLIEMGATEREIRREVFKVRARRLWEGWLRVGKRMVDNLATLLLSITYFLLGPLFFLFARQKLASRFVEYDNNRLKRL